MVATEQKLSALLIIHKRNGLVAVIAVDQTLNITWYVTVIMKFLIKCGIALSLKLMNMYTIYSPLKEALGQYATSSYLLRKSTFCRNTAFW